MVVEIAPSILAADASRLGEECRAIAEAGAHRVHWDVMDGVFVPNLTFGPDVVAACRPAVDLPFEAHLMVVKPDELAPLYVEAGCDTVLIHAETCPHLHRSLAAISEAGARCGVVINPHTPASSVSEVIGMIDEVLVMTVNPGFGGQSYIASVESKIAAVRKMIDDSGRSIDLEVDGRHNRSHRACRGGGRGERAGGGLGRVRPPRGPGHRHQGAVGQRLSLGGRRSADNTGTLTRLTGGVRASRRA